MHRTAARLAGFVVVMGCASSNPYGHGRTYQAQDAEQAYLEAVKDVSYEEVRRDPSGYSGQLLGWFGVVTALEALPNDEATLALDLRFHQPRHLCRDQSEDSCRVTVSKRAGGPFTTRVKLPAGSEFGSIERLNIGSLVKVYGKATGEFDARGGPVLATEWFRYWPHGAYVTTTGSAATMRR